MCEPQCDLWRMDPKVTSGHLEEVQFTFVLGWPFSAASLPSIQPQLSQVTISSASVSGW